MNVNDSKQRELKLFQILRVRGNVLYLVDDQHSFTDIQLRINKLKNDGLLQVENGTLNFTQKGKDYYKQLCKDLNKRGMYRYFMEADNHRVTAISLDDIYIPKRRLKNE